MRRLDLEPLADERLEPPRRAMEGVALGTVADGVHALGAELGPARPTPSRNARASAHGRRTARRGPGEEAGLDEQRHRVGLGHRLAVEALDREPLRAARRGRARRARRAPAGATPRRVAQRHERAAAALDVERRLAAEQDDVRARDARRARAGALRPRAAPRRTAAPDRRRRARAAPGSSSGLAQLAQPLDGAAERELRAAEALDEVAAAAEAERLERAQLGVDGAVAAGDALGADAVAGDDALPLEQQLGERAPLRRRRRRAARCATSGPASRSTAGAREREKRRGRRSGFGTP